MEPHELRAYWNAQDHRKRQSKQEAKARKRYLKQLSKQRKAEAKRRAKYLDSLTEQGREHGTGTETTN